MIDDLNEPQRRAVLHPGGPLLVLAGAGSGKTRVITRRVAHLVRTAHVPPWQILAVTFTNKAALEMKGRIAKLLDEDADRVTVRTFHSFAALALRQNAEHAGLKSNFLIYDDADQMQLARRAVTNAGFEAGSITPREVLGAVERWKNVGVRSKPEEDDFEAEQLDKVVTEYERMLRAANAVDFSDLLLLFENVLATNEEVRLRYQRRFTHVLVDEFQDTNRVQYALLKHIAPPPASNLVVVGDDDQSIYRWRGAEVRNILDFPKEYPGSTQIALEQNYRSDQNILEAAHAVIAKNPQRMAKKLWSAREDGDAIEVIAASDERTEAEAIAERIRALVDSRETRFEGVAVFFRTNALSRTLESVFRQRQIPYTLVSGRSFYERAEIKDAISYLRLMVNPRSDVDLERVINTPQRGIGATTFERLSAYARDGGMSLFEALGAVQEVPGLNSQAVRRLWAFRGLLDRLIACAAMASDATTCARTMLDETRLIAVLEQDGGEEANARADNLRELLSATVDFDQAREATPAPAALAVAPPLPPAAQGNLFVRPPEFVPTDARNELGEPALLGFLEQLSLLGDADGEDGGSTGRVSMMTLHAAKGLEFDAVFLTAMEEGIFPHRRALDDDAEPEELAEERRLCYVGFTRARKHLSVSFAQCRTTFGQLNFNPPSRFLLDVPPALLTGDPLFRSATPRFPAASRPTSTSSGGPVVDRTYDQSHDWGGDSAHNRIVLHSLFGRGVVKGVRGSGEGAKFTVDFDTVGRKTVVARFLSPG